MTQEERIEEAEQARQFDRMREQGVSLAEIGASRAKGTNVKFAYAPEEQNEAEKEEVELKEQV